MRPSLAMIALTGPRIRPTSRRTSDDAVMTNTCSPYRLLKAIESWSKGQPIGTRPSRTGSGSRVGVNVAASSSGAHAGVDRTAEVRTQPDFRVISTVNEATWRQEIRDKG